MSGRWLCCSQCHSGILCSNEILHEVAPTLSEAVFTYSLEIFETDVPVYSATNPTSERYDVVRGVMDPTTEAPAIVEPSDVQFIHMDLARGLLMRLQRSTTPTNDGQTPQQLLEDLDNLADQGADTDDSYEDRRTIYASRIVSIGDPSAEFSWFPNYSWTVIYCATCMTHMGWAFFQDEALAFVGLIVTHLREKHFT